MLTLNWYMYIWQTWFSWLDVIFRLKRGIAGDCGCFLREYAYMYKITCIYKPTYQDLAIIQNISVRQLKKATNLNLTSIPFWFLAPLIIRWTIILCINSDKHSSWQPQKAALRMLYKLRDLNLPLFNLLNNLVEYMALNRPLFTM